MRGQTMKGGHESVRNMAERYNDSITFDGHRYDCGLPLTAITTT